MKLTKIEKSWILYDVANSAFILLITAILPEYFAAIATAGGIANNHITSLWGAMTSISVLVLAVSAPILGAIADYKGNKMKLFILFLVLGIGSAFGFVVTETWQAFAILFVMSRIGYSACNVFYDSMLVDVTTDERMDTVSTHGYAWGYVGSTIPFILGIVFIMFGDSIGIGTIMAIKISILITLVWWLVLSLPLIRNVKQNYYHEPTDHVISKSFKGVFETFKKIRTNKKLGLYILAYFFFIDGVYTVISMATRYGGEVGIETNSMILALLLTQFVAFPFAIFAGRLARKYNPLTIIQVFIGIYVGCCLFAFNLEHAWQFWVLAVFVGLAQGGIQALSRSYFGKLIPKESSNEYFGFFDIFGKFADFLGPLIISVFAYFNLSKYGILSLVVLFILGFVLLVKVKKIEKEEAAAL